MNRVRATVPMAILAVLIALGTAARGADPLPPGTPLVNYVDPSLLTNTPPATTALTPALTGPRYADSARRRLPPSRLRPTTAQKWRKFEAEFGIQQPSADPFKATMEQAKYELDKMVFEIQRLEEDLRDMIEFDYSMRNLTTSERHLPRRYYSNFMDDAFENARLKSSLGPDDTGRFFVGIKLVVPTGN